MVNPDVVIGGFGTSKYQVDQLADAMSDHLDYEVQGVTLVDATRRIDVTAEIVAGKHVFTHSAGFVALKGVLDTYPELSIASATAVAPPSVTDRRALVSRSHKIVRNLAVESLLETQSFKSNILHAGYMVREMHKNGLHHIGTIPRIARFDSHEVAKYIDAPVRLAIMKRDELFRYPAVDADDLARHDVTVVEVMGTHPDFVRKPAKVLTALGYTAANTTVQLAVEYPVVSAVTRAAIV